MSSIFRRDDEYVEKPNRNTVDFSFQNNLTAKFGALYPCLCTPVIPGDSLSIKPTFGLKFMPMTFPVQTRMKASIHYFYVRNRNLWKDWPDFIGKTKDGLVPPYIHLTEQNRKIVETGQLGDYLGIPSELYDTVYQGADAVGFRDRIVNNTPLGYEQVTSGSEYFYFGDINNDFVGQSLTEVFTQGSGSAISAKSFAFSAIVPFIETGDYRIKVDFTHAPLTTVNYKLLLFGSDGKCKWQSSTFNMTTSQQVPYTQYIDGLVIDDSFYSGDIQSGTRRPNMVMFLVHDYPDNGIWFNNPILTLGHEVTERKSSADMMLSELPWRSDFNSNGIPLSALPFRAYESIYNTFYRNAENNPLIINGVPEYNKWLRTADGGADTNFYPLMYHNWEDDFLTTAVPSPQQGNAPLVGLSGTPTLTIAHDDGSTTTMNLEVDDDGNVTAATPQSGDAATHAALVDAVNYGISINDFRNVNSFQRWLENNIRRGYKYRDQIKTHYGVTVRYDELDMPEFIGGTSEHVMVNQISQTTPIDGKGLGDMAGQASAVGQGQTITHYCDEHGFIIGILCIKPVANYSQLLPKFFNVTDTFDYYFPEFGHIGMQPITYAEVTPLQANLEGKLNDVFGYQRAWYDLIAKTDEVHGLFRSDFRNFLINRTFDGTPELGADFTVINPEQINDVFQYQGDTDKILGQIYMEISKKTPIPLYGIPKLE